MVLLLQLHAVLNPPLCISKGLVLQFAHQLGVEAALLGSNRVQVPHTLHVPLHGCHVQWGVVVIVQAPDVGSKGDEEGEAVQVAVSCCQVEGGVPPDVTFVWIAPRQQEKQLVSMQGLMTDSTEMFPAVQGQISTMNCWLSEISSYMPLVPAT